METQTTPGNKTEIGLPKLRYDSSTSIEKALRERRSVRTYKDDPLTLEAVGQLLWAAQGVTSHRGLRTAPSAGALYPLETYVVAGNVKDIPAGIYRYLPERHAIELVVPGDRRNELCMAALGQTMIRKAPASLVFSAVFERTTSKYGQRGIRYVHIDLGHATENVYLQAVSLSIGTVFVGAFDDGVVKKVMSMPHEEEPLAIMPVGRI